MKNQIVRISAFILIGVFSFSCTQAQKKKNKETTKSAAQLKGLSKAYFASGCFWCVEAVYESLTGVEEVISGYSGGTQQNPTYEQVGSGRTGHAEAVEVYYDPSKIDFKTLVEVFYDSQDPTTIGQKPDFGSQYRSIIFYQNDSEKNIAEAYMDSLTKAKIYAKPIVTEIVPFEKFWEAEGYHQNYEKLNPYQPYVVGVSIPRLKRFQAKHPELLKKEHE
jgi:peptide-methionine (S)-S-oxide reductase